ncbi:3121_t:CDS:10 [Cetraspora pellucida]|uniref:3121_t:CDS:1 n=1 Tax=Cetraspora pellucida TaxID=1433469 RepID=A0A9N9AFV9_9GLOM|nr:3121_t:CDS:10 [Cetraspora pellucida]
MPPKWNPRYQHNKRFQRKSNPRFHSRHQNKDNAYNLSLNNINQSIDNIHPNSISGLRKVSELPDRFRSLFPFGVFNSIQSQCIDTALYTNENLVVIAPTGSGKTVVFELAMINVLMNSNDHARMVYMAPTKIDEVHILHEDRGAILEAVVSRMKLMGTYSRFIAISATVPNIEDVASWINLGFQSDNKFPQNNVKILQFGDEYRPVRLSRQVLSYPSDGNIFKFDKTLNDKLLDIIQQYSNGKPSMVFCITRKSTEEACQAIVKQIKNMHKDLPWNIRPIEITFHDKQLQEFVKYGVVFHHAGLHMQDRKNIESMFLQGATSTLAIGVNLPAHLVVIKSTTAYKNGGFMEYSDSEIKQMLGRAGRPQFDDSGIALVTGIKDKLESRMKSNPQRYDPGFKEGQNWEKRLEGKFQLEKVSQAEEFNEVKLYRHDKLALNKLNQHADIKFPLSGKVKETREKVFIMIQVVLGNVPLEDSSTRVQFNTESRVIIQHSHRILKCLVELAAYRENIAVLKVSINLARCMKAKMWNDSPLILKQLDGIGEQYAKKLADAGITNFEQLTECEPWRIETACNRYPPFGHNVHETVSSLPKFKLDVERGVSNSPEYQIYIVNICLSNNKKISTKRNGINLNAAFIAATEELLLEFRQMPLWKIQQGLKFHFKTNIQINQLIICSVLPEEFIGLDVYKTIVPDIQFADICESPKKFEINKTSSTKEKEKQHDNNIKGPELLPNGRVKCNHPCKDKQKCAHECCKIGCRRAPKKRKNNNVTFSEEMKSQPTTHVEHDFSDQSWLETLDMNESATHVEYDFPDQSWLETLDTNESATHVEYDFPDQSWLETLDINEPATHGEYDCLDQSWFETWNMNEFDLMDLDEDKFSELPELPELPELQEMTIENKKDADKEELVNEENTTCVEIENTNKIYDNLTSDTDFEISWEVKNEMNCKTFTEALDVFDYVLQTIL